MLYTLGLGLSETFDRSKTHILTLSFDDGFKKSFYKVAEIYKEHGLRACLNVVALGHVHGAVKDEWIEKSPLGDFNDWNKLKSAGHEVMLHTYDHKNLTQLPLSEAKENIDKCFEYFEKNLQGFKTSEAVYNFAYNESTLELDQYVLKRARAIRTDAGLVLSGLNKINPLPKNEKAFRLGCLAYGPGLGDEHVDSFVNDFLAKPNGWLIINLHGLDDEGWGPISSKYLDGLLKRCRKIENLEVVPTGEVVNR